MKTLITTSLMASSLIYAATKESRNLRLVCDFNAAGEVGESAGKYQIDLNIAKRNASLKCLSGDCGMTVDRDVWPIVMNTAGKKAGISLLKEESADYQPSYITLKGTNHDDGDLLLTLGIGTLIIDHEKGKRIEIKPQASAYMTWTEHPANGFFPGKSVQCSVELK